MALRMVLVCYTRLSMEYALYRQSYKRSAKSNNQCDISKNGAESDTGSPQAVLVYVVGRGTAKEEPREW